ncbi:MAG TPA: hypothetical protein VHK47_18315 [Polyangia bacterium]|nr:hypothetical protein [Polyangia bacterium]
MACSAFLGLMAPAAALAQDRPSEQDMFGGGSTPDAGAPAPPPGPRTGAAPEPGEARPPASPATVTAPPAAASDVASPAPGSSDRDSALLGGGPTPEHLSGYIAPDNPLQIGGQLYLRSQTSGRQNTDAWTLTSPSLLDVYLDARPNPRVRAFVLGRMSFDPTAPPGSATSMQVMNGSNGAFVGTSATGFTTFSNQRGPTTLLDQMWLRFDILNTVFVTAGKQHVRWGTGRFWQPTDYLHPIKRNPLDVFDARPGETMVKLHVPWEARGWNFYGFAVTEDPNQATDTLNKVAYGARAEIILFDAEIGLDGLFKKGQKPRLGFDFSTGIWELDVYGDVGLRWGQDFCAVYHAPGPLNFADPNPCPVVGTAPTDPAVLAQANMFDLAPLTGMKVQAVGGINWSHKYNDNDLFTIGGEYFYNQPGYSDTSLYPGLLLNSNYTPQFNFFYTGRQYAALFASFPQPYSWNLSTFTLSTLTNITDQSYVSRLDYSYVLLTHITLEAFAALHYGKTHGEFRFGVDLPNAHIDPLLVDLGLALRVKI